MFKLLKISDAKAQIEELETKAEAYKEELALAESETAAAKDFASDLQGIIAEKDVELEGLKHEVAEAQTKAQELKDASVTAAEVATEIVAQCGADEPLEQETEASQTNEELWEEFNTLTDAKAKAEFYQQHREQLIKR